MKNTNLYLADKSKLIVGDKVACDNGIMTITQIENGGCIGESITGKKELTNKTYWLSNATLFTSDKNKSLK